MANSVNDFLCSIRHAICKQFDSSFPEFDQLDLHGSFEIPDVKTEFISNEIIKMATSRATCIDGLPVKRLKFSFNHAGDIYHFTFNEFISSCKYLDALVTYIRLMFRPCTLNPDGNYPQFYKHVIDP